GVAAARGPATGTALALSFASDRPSSLVMARALRALRRLSRRSRRCRARRRRSARGAQERTVPAVLRQGRSEAPKVAGKLADRAREEGARRPLAGVRGRAGRWNARLLQARADVRGVLVLGGRELPPRSRARLVSR